MRSRRWQAAHVDAAAFAVEIDERAGETVLTLHGELDSWTAQQTLIDALASVEGNVLRIVLDLCDLTSIDVGNIGVLRRAQMFATLRGAEMVLRSPTPHVERVLEVTGLRSSNGSDGNQPIPLPLPGWAYDRAPRGPV